MAITRRGLHHLGDQSGAKQQQRARQRVSAVKLVLERLRLQTVCMSGVLHDRPTHVYGTARSLDR
jgi:hypothetical protein